MGNLALHSAEEPDDLRATTGTVEIPTRRKMMLRSRQEPEQHDPVARHNITMFKCKHTLSLVMVLYLQIATELSSMDQHRY